jgi:hypothetical protein
MFRTTLKFALFLVGGNLLLGLSLIITAATRGISDMDFSYPLLLLVYYLNFLPVILLHYLFGPRFVAVSEVLKVSYIVLLGILQWALFAFLLAGVYCGIKSMFRRCFLVGERTPRKANGGNA